MNHEGNNFIRERIFEKLQQKKTTEEKYEADPD